MQFNVNNPHILIMQGRCASFQHTFLFEIVTNFLRSKLTEEYTDQVKSTELIEETLAKDLVKLTSSWQSSQKVAKSAEDDLKSATQLTTRNSKP